MNLSRRRFLRQTAGWTAGALLAPALLAPRWLLGETGEPAIIGHGSHRYKVNLAWGELDRARYPVKDCHEMVQDSRGRIVLLTNETRNNVIIYDRSGRLLETWGTEYPGAHGLTLSRENGEDFLWISDNARHEVIKTTIDGRVVLTLPYPKESGKYAGPQEYIPTEVAVAPNGDVYVADGYGLQYVLRYSAEGELLGCFGGRGDGPEHLRNAHGIALDDRQGARPTLLVTARQQNALKRYSLAGEYEETIPLPGAFVCRPVIHGQEVYLAVLISRLPWDSGSGYVTILDRSNRVISNPGGSEPSYRSGKLEPMNQTIRVFRHPHDVCVDDDENLYVAQWNSGGVYPIKLVRV